MTEAQMSRHVEECLTSEMLITEERQREEHRNAPPVTPPDTVPPTSIPSQDPHPPWLDAFIHPEAGVESPFLIQCPYSGCTVKMEAMHFFVHVVGNHQVGPQAFPCPICALQGFTAEVNSSTNLLQHLNTKHMDMLSQADLLQYTVEVNNNPPPIQIPDAPGTGTVESVLSLPTNRECPICLVEMTTGDTVLTLECLCMFHSACLQNWYAKSEKSDCPVHGK
ncbi:hypothetical protein Pelo_2186 [Pelomyxa schiedti]|nr:hypothetical protein Pelo_2186 [Pelomyxa schiedti]